MVNNHWLVGHYHNHYYNHYYYNCLDLFGGLEDFFLFFFHMLGTTDELHHFSEGWVETTNQIKLDGLWMAMVLCTNCLGHGCTEFESVSFGFAKTIGWSDPEKPRICGLNRSGLTRVASCDRSVTIDKLIATCGLPPRELILSWKLKTETWPLFNQFFIILFNISSDSEGALQFFEHIFPDFKLFRHSVDQPQRYLLL